MTTATRRQSLPVRVAVAFLLLGIVALAAGPAAAQDDEADASGQVRILEVSGLLDPVLHDFLIAQLDEAEADGILAVILQVDSAGAVIDDAELTELARRLRDTPLQTLGWVPTSGQARGGSAELLGVVDTLGVAIGATIGETGPARLPDEFGPAFGAATERLESTLIGARDAVELGLVPDEGGAVALIGSDDADALDAAYRRSIESNSVLREFIRNVDGFRAPQTEDDDAAQVGQAQFRQLSLSGQLFHTAASPELAYLFFAGGMMLLLFELYTAGIGVAGVVAAALFGMGTYGLGVLPTRPIGVLLLVLAMAAFAVDIQTNIPRLYSGIGMVLFIAGTFLLYDGVSMSWITIGFGIVGAALYAYSGMPSMVRTRFSTPTIGRRWMIGTMGEAVTDLTPEGTVTIDDAPWRAITNRATPITSGDRVRVIGLQRLVLEVEPEEGGARDYRERG